MSTLPPPPYTCWAPADEWRAEFVMLGANVDTIPTAPPRSTVIIGKDGLWGAHEWTVYAQPHRPEFPYLAWIPLRPSKNSSVPSNVLTRSVGKSMWQAHPNGSNLHVIVPDLLDELTVKWKSLKDDVQDPFNNISSHLGSSIQRPMQAYTRAIEALSQMEKDFRSWRDFVEVFRNLQRSLLELQAFLDWWKDIRAGHGFQSPVRAPTRGSIFEDTRVYANYVRWSVRAFLLIHKSTFVLDPTKKVALSPRTLCNAQPMSPPDQPVLHSLHHWYYPPIVHDIMTELETTARGYMERLDIFNPTKGHSDKLRKRENKMSDEAGRRAKKAKAEMAALVTQPNKEIRRLCDAGAAPDWFPGIQEVWVHAMNHISHLDLTSKELPRRFAFPPVHLFWGCEPQNQRIYYYHYLLLFNEIKNRSEHDLLALTTQEWRYVLGNTYWKKQWLRHDENDTSAFDPNMFWKYGGSLLFGDEQSANVVAGCYNPTSQLSCHCDVQLTTADDTNIRQVVLYYLNSFHTYEEIKEMEHHQFPTTFKERWKVQALRVNKIVEMWDPSGGSVNPDFFHDKEVWISWVRELRGLVADWSGFEHWDWGNFSEVRTMEIDGFSKPDFHKFTVRLLIFFIHSFVTHLGYYPSPLLRPPTLAAHSCTDHSEKFGNALVTLPLPVK